MQLNRCEQSLTLEGKKYFREEIVHLISSVSEVTSPFLLDLYHFLADWFNDSPFIDSPYFGLYRGTQSVDGP